MTALHTQGWYDTKYHQNTSKGIIISYGADKAHSKEIIQTGSKGEQLFLHLDLKKCLTNICKISQGFNPFTALYKCTLYAWENKAILILLWCYKIITNVGIYTKFFLLVRDIWFNV